MKAARCIILTLAALLALGVHTASAASPQNHEWDHPQSIAQCVATSGGVCPL